jgi:hypothetical protein
MIEPTKESSIPFPRCSCGEPYDFINETPGYSVMRCDNPACEKFDRPMISRNVRYLALLDALIKWV